MESESYIFFPHHYGDEQDVSSNPLCLLHLKIADCFFPSVNSFIEDLHRIPNCVTKSPAKSGARCFKGELQ